jgi:SOS-response transcriptional repressor LexA
VPEKWTDKTRPDWAQKIEGVRRRLRLSQVDFAARLDTTQSNVSKWEKGEYRPSPKQFMGLARIAEGEVESLLFMEMGGVPQSWFAREQVPALPVALAGDAAGDHTGKSAVEIIAEGYLEDQGNMRHVPLLKNSAAMGTPRATYETEVERVIGIEKDWLPRGGALYAVKIEGDSMSPILETGYVVVIDISRTEPEQLVDRMVAVKVDDHLTIKWLRREPESGIYMLVPQNASVRHPIRIFNAGSSMVLVGEVVNWTGWQTKALKRK